VSIDPRNADWQRDLGRVQGLLADCLRWSGDIDAATRLYQESLAIMRPLAAASRTVAARQRDLANAELGAGWGALALGSASLAASHAESVKSVLLDLVVKGGDREAARISAEGLLLAADAASKSGRPAEARSMREAALAVIPPGAPRQLEPRVLATRARALLALDRVDEAAPAVEQLQAMSYRHPTLITLWNEKRRALKPAQP